MLAAQGPNGPVAGAGNFRACSLVADQAGKRMLVVQGIKCRYRIGS